VDDLVWDRLSEQARRVWEAYQRYEELDRSARRVLADAEAILKRRVRRCRDRPLPRD